MRTRLHGGYCLNIEYMPNIVYNRQMKGAEFMAERLASLSVYNYIYAALIAFVVTYLIMKVKNFKKNIESRDELAMDYGHIDRNSVMERCIKMFPIETVVFKGNVFEKGMTVRITTMQKKVFQGEFVGKNDMDIICILTKDHIIAHEIRKITDMVSVDDKTADDRGVL